MPVPYIKTTRIHSRLQTSDFPRQDSFCIEVIGQNMINYYIFVIGCYMLQTESNGPHIGKSYSSIIMVSN